MSVDQGTHRVISSTFFKIYSSFVHSVQFNCEIGSVDDALFTNSHCLQLLGQAMHLLRWSRYPEEQVVQAAADVQVEHPFVQFKHVFEDSS